MAEKKPNIDTLTFIVRNLQNISGALTNDRITNKYASERLYIEIRDLCKELGLDMKEE